MRSIQSRLREKVLIEQNYGPAEVDSRTCEKMCWVCGGKASPRFRLRDSTSLCFPCFRSVYFDLLLPLINNESRAKNSQCLISKIEAASKNNSDPNGETIVVRLPSEVPSAIRSTRSSEGSPLTAPLKCWECQRCTYSNLNLDDVCAACGFKARKSSIVCKVCNKDCYTALDKSGVTNSNATCKSGIPHVIWYCKKCEEFNSLDADYCGCGADREWICSQCTELHHHPRNQDGLRYCQTCGSFNTPDDVTMGQATMDEELQRAREQEIKGSVVFGVNDSATVRERSRQLEISENKQRLDSRLRQLGVKPNNRVSDGNCLFSALANQIFGREALANVVRLMIVEYMLKNTREYVLLFDGQKDFDEYMSKMRRSGTWGDELCINAAARCFRVDIHVLTSTVGRWHLVFRHDDLASSQVQPSRSTVASSSVALFLSYQSPVHYEDISFEGIVKLNFTEYLIPKLQKMIDEVGSRPAQKKQSENKKNSSHPEIPLPLHRCASSKSLNSSNPPDKLPVRHTSLMVL